MYKQLARVLAVTSAAVLVSTLAGPAQAATRSFTDRAGDVGHGVDLRAARVINGEHVVRVRLTHRDLVRSPRSGAGAVIYFDTDAGDAGPEYALAAGLFEGTDYALLSTNGWNLRRGTERVDCHYRMRLDYVEDLTRTRFAHGCFGDANRLRIEVRTGGTRRDGTHVTDWLGSPRSFAPWVPRG